MWLYVPQTSSPSAQASEDLNSASALLSDCAAEALAESCTSRGKPLQPQAWSRQWKRGGFIRRLSGVTCSPSTLEHGVASFISSLREIPVRTIPSPESERERTENDSSLPKSSVSPRSAGLILSSARTSRGTRTDNSRPSSRHWKHWAIALRQEYSVRPKPEIPCAASDCSSWPSAKVSRGGYEVQKDGSLSPTLEGAAVNWPGPDATNRVRDEETLAKCAAFRLRNAGQKTVPLYLAEVAQQWEAPSVAVTEGSRMTRGGDRSDELLLTGQAMEASKPWAGPAAQNHKGSSEGSSEGSITRQDGKSREDILSYQAELFFRPPSSPDQPIAGGSMSSTDSPNSNQPSAKRKLNPMFVEALMRWPTGLSGFERPAMALTRWQQLMPSFLSMLCSQATEQEQPDLFGAML